MATPALHDPFDPFVALLGVETSVQGEEKYGRYVTGSEIGTGSMGRVFRAVDPLANRVVAIKTLRPEFQGRSTEGAYRQRLLREAEAAGRLSHTSVVRMFDQGEGFLVMELLTGSLLSKLGRERGVFTLAEAVPILTTVADALDHAHSRGVIHRDVRPANILVQQDGSTKLLDFGLSRFVGEEVAPGDRFTGSVWYMAPEQITDGAATPQSDLFSLAAVAYEMLTGHQPFDGDNVGTVTYRIVYEPFEPLTARNRALPAVLDEVFVRALAKDPAARLPTVTAFVRALEAQLPRPLPRPARQTHSLAPVPQSSRATQDLSGVLQAAEVAAAGSWARRLEEPETCAIQVDSDPAGAEVRVDGISMGATPLVLTDLSAGTHAVRVGVGGFAPIQLTLELWPSAIAPRFGFALQPLGLPAGRRKAPRKAPSKRSPLAALAHQRPS